MRSTRKTIIAVTAAAALGIAGCADGSDLGPGSQPDPAPVQDDDAEDAEPAGAETDESEGEAPDGLDVTDGEAADNDWQYIEEFDEPFVWEDAGLRVSITGIGLSDVTSDEVPSEVTDFIEEDTQTVLVLEMTVSNDSGTQVDFYPSQGTVQILREQLEADLWFSDSIAGSDWRDGVDDSGQVFWMLSTPFEEAVAAGELTYLTSSVWDADFEEVTSGAEITVTWER